MRHSSHSTTCPAAPRPRRCVSARRSRRSPAPRPPPTCAPAPTTTVPRDAHVRRHAAPSAPRAPCPHVARARRRGRCRRGPPARPGARCGTRRCCRCRASSRCDVTEQAGAVPQHLRKQVLREVDVRARRHAPQRLRLEDVDARVDGVAEDLAPGRLLQEALDAARLLVDDHDAERERVLHRGQRDGRFGAALLVLRIAAPRSKSVSTSPLMTMTRSSPSRSPRCARRPPCRSPRRP
jgi:hypothetical protein